MRNHTIVVHGAAQRHLVAKIEPPILSVEADGTQKIVDQLPQNFSRRKMVIDIRIVVCHISWRIPCVCASTD